MTRPFIHGANALKLDETAKDRPLTEPAGDLAARVEQAVAAATAAAVAVDRDARFPAEAIGAARAQHLLGIMVPRELGGEGATVSQVADVCYRLGRACSSAGMIYAMHQVSVACLVRHGRDSVWHQKLMLQLAADQLLFASSTTEGQGGGNVRSSAAAIERDGSRIGLERSATVISYGAEADGIFTVARRSSDAPASDQILATFVKKDYSLDPLAGWDTLGMRGTCSAGFKLRASGDGEQILPAAYDKIHAQTMTPVAHLLWASVWAGIAAAAVERAQSFMRNAARQAAGQLPPGGAHFTKAHSSLRVLRGFLSSALAAYEEACDDERKLTSIDFQTAVNLAKVDASELAVSTVMSALRACGLSGYRNDGDFTVGRLLRDVLSSPIMINNDRILSNLATASLVTTVPSSLSD